MDNEESKEERKENVNPNLIEEEKEDIEESKEEIKVNTNLFQDGGEMDEDVDFDDDDN